MTFNYQDPDASRPRRAATDDEGRDARRRAELRTGEAAEVLGDAVADDLTADRPNRSDRS